LFAYKIPDAGHSFAISKPCDGFFVGTSVFGCWEGKKTNGLSAFNFNKFEPQQIPYLSFVKTCGFLSTVVIFASVPRKSVCFIFDIDVFTKKGLSSILKKDLERLMSYAVKLEKSLFDLSGFSNKIIGIEQWEKQNGAK
jgi:penicillin-binding protein-related factor A (putative recombinase)